jgi:hypothetical protein
MVTIVNNTLIQNSVPLGAGAGIWFDGLDATIGSVVANNILVANDAIVGGGIDHTLFSGDITRNDLFGNTGGDLYVAGQSNASLSENMFIDPMFAGSSSGNYRLDPESPLIDAAKEALSPISDVDGFWRPFDGDEDTIAVADIGAFEYPSGEVFDLMFVAPDSLLWEVRVGENRFNLYRGDFNRLRISGIYTQNPERPLADQFCGLLPSALPFVDSFDPPAGSLVFYLVTLTNSRKTFEGSLGEQTSGAIRPNDFFCP